MKKSFSRLVLCVAISAVLCACGRSEDTVGAGQDDSKARLTLADCELMPRDLFFDNPTRIQGRISPDGSKLSFIAPLDGVQNLWVGPVGDFEGTKAVTTDKLREIDSHQWAFNGQNVLYIRDQGGDEGFHIYSVALDTGETQDLPPFDKTNADISEVIVNPETNEPLAYSVNYLRKEWFGITDDVEEDLLILRDALSGDISILAQTQDDRIWTVISDGALSYTQATRRS